MLTTAPHPDTKRIYKQAARCAIAPMAIVSDKCCFSSDLMFLIPFLCCQSTVNPRYNEDPRVSEFFCDSHSLCVILCVLLALCRYIWHHIRRAIGFSRAYTYEVHLYHLTRLWQHCWHALLMFTVFVWAGDMSVRLYWLDFADGQCEGLGKFYFIQLCAVIVPLHSCLCKRAFPCVDTLFLMTLSLLWMSLVRHLPGKRQNLYDFRDASAADMYHQFWSKHENVRAGLNLNPLHEILVVLGAVVPALFACASLVLKVANCKNERFKRALHNFMPPALFFVLGHVFAGIALPSLTKALGGTWAVFCYHNVSLQCVALLLNYNDDDGECTYVTYIRRTLCPLAFCAFGVPPMTILSGVCLAGLPVGIRPMFSARAVHAWIVLFLQEQ